MDDEAATPPNSTPSAACTPLYQCSANGWRLVQAYAFEYKKAVGPRWAGCALGDVYRDEFSDASTYPFIERAIALGLITVNNQTVPPSHRLRAGDAISHWSHRHEPPVAFVPASCMIVHDDGDVLVIDKPATVPIHPCGAYNLNSALQILFHEHGLSNLHTIHRLDRMTSGLCILARTAAGAKRFHAALSRLDPSLRAEKTYLALVKGRLPASAEVLPAALRIDLERRSDNGDAFAVERGGGDVLEVRYPVRVVDPKRGVHECHPDGRPSTSRFREVAFDAATATSLVLCAPVTGRTHQLRLHLQLIGTPIANDYAYGGDDPWQPPPHAAPTQAPGEGDGGTQLQRLIEACPTCNGLATALKRPEGIYLHALRFRLMRDGVVEWDFSTPLPRWAADRLVGCNANNDLVM